MSGEQLEQRYRSLLRILPKSYREVREEELLSVLMEKASEERRWPEPREVLSLAGLGIRIRAGAAAGGLPENARVAAMVRAVAIAGSVLLSFFGTTQLVLVADYLRRAPGVRWNWKHPFTVEDRHLSHFNLLGSGLPALWLAVLALLAFGWWRTARVLAIVVFLAALYYTKGATTAVSEETVLAGVTAAAIFAVRGVHARSTGIPGVLSVTALVGVVGWAYEGHYGAPFRASAALQGWGETPSRSALYIVGAMVAVGAVLAFRSTAWSVALAVVGVAVLGPALVRAEIRPFPPQIDLVPQLFLTGALVAVAGLAVLRERLTVRREEPTAAN
jgi:hypothetical protein